MQTSLAFLSLRLFFYRMAVAGRICQDQKDQVRPTGMITMVYLLCLYFRPLTTVSGFFMWVLEIQTWVLTPAQQSLYPQTHPPCVFLFDLNSLLNFFRESVHLC